MASLIQDPRGYRRPMRKAVINEFVASLAGSTPTITAKDFRFPLNRAIAARLAAAINSLDKSDKAFVNGGLQNYVLSPGQTLKGYIDGVVSLKTATFDAAAAIVTGTGATFSAMAGESMSVQIGAGSVQVITFGTEASQALAIAKINSLLVGAVASAVDANNVRLTSTQQGTGARIRTSSVAVGITSKLGIPNNADQAGTGDVANIAAVTGAEAATVIGTDWGAGVSVSVVDNHVRITSASYGASSAIEILAATTATGLGFPVGITGKQLGSISQRQLHDPWSKKAIERLKAVII